MEVHYPSIYKHFKHELYPDEYIYATMGIAHRVDRETYREIYNKSNNDELFANHTETGEVIPVIKYGMDYYYYKYGGVKDEELVLYKSLYDGSGIYARPIEMFTSKVDKEKYPEIEQEYRFELIN